MQTPSVRGADRVPGGWLPRPVRGWLALTAHRPDCLDTRAGVVSGSSAVQSVGVCFIQVGTQVLRAAASQNRPFPQSAPTLLPAIPPPHVSEALYPGAKPKDRKSTRLNSS